MSARCRVALLGFGTVGSAVARRLLAAEPGAPSNIQLTHIFDRRAAREARVAAAPIDVVWTIVDRRRPPQRRRRRRRSDRRRRAGRRLDPRGAARRQVGGHRQQAGDRAPWRRAADAGRAAGPAAALRSRGRRRDADRPRHRRRPGRRPHHAPGRDPERHDQRGAVADGGDRLHARRGGARRAGARLRRGRSRPPISTATTRAPSWRSSARWRSGCASIPRRSTIRSSASHQRRRLRAGTAARRDHPADRATPTTTTPRRR